MDINSSLIVCVFSSQRPIHTERLRYLGKMVQYTDTIVHTKPRVRSSTTNIIVHSDMGNFRTNNLRTNNFAIEPAPGTEGIKILRIFFSTIRLILKK